MLLFDRTICRRRLAKQRSCASATAVTPRAHRAFFFDAMRHKVSKKKKRTQTSIDSVEFDLDLLLAYAQATKTKGRVLSVALRWGAIAFGIPELEAMGNEPTLLHHVPGKILGAATTPSREQNKAPWISDDIVRFVADLCHDPDDLVKARALFIYLHAICGLRDQDVQHITDIRIMNMAIVVIASYWKSSADKEVCECSTMPLLLVGSDCSILASWPASAAVAAPTMAGGAAAHRSALGRC